MPKNEFICDCHPIDEELVLKTKNALPNNEKFNKLADFFSIVGNNTRCKILFALKENWETLLYEVSPNRGALILSLIL